MSGFPYSANGELTVADAILLAGGLLPNASEQAFLIRKNPENAEQRQYVRLDLANNLSMGRQLRPFDSLVVYTTERFNDPFPVSIRGAVRQPGTYVYDPSLGFSDLFTLAGGLRFEAARNRVDVFRLQYNQNDATRTINTALEIDENFAIIGGPPGFSLQPYDVVVVRSVPEFELIRTVTVAGEVRYPGDYALDSDNLRLTDLVIKAGGLTAEAFPAGATLLRQENEVGLVVIQLDDVLRDDKIVTNITLKEGDALFVPKARDLVAIRPLGTLAPQFLEDSLYLDGTLDVAFAGKKSGKWYVNNYAAGFADNARRRSLTVQYPNGELGRTKKFLWFNNYPEVRPGSLVRIDTKKTKARRKEREEPVDWVGITQATLAGVTTLLTLFILVRQTNN
jgi:protein involved in polysaccharide export with SLBB domain